MDPVTHLVLGATVAQLPANDETGLTLRKRCIIGSCSALFPDSDYVLFFWEPLQFLAYWHRAETHSLLLLPFWALMLALFWRLLLGWHLQLRQIYMICLFALLSHIVIDSFTTFGVQLFAPFSSERFSWYTAFVIDGYFSLTIFIAFVAILFGPNRPTRALWLLFPIAYLCLLLIIRQWTMQQIIPLVPQISRQPELVAQPFSLLYWQVIDNRKGRTRVAYIKLAHDPIAKQISRLSGFGPQSQDYHAITDLSWIQLNQQLSEPKSKELFDAAWNHPRFKAFHDFAVWPVVYQIEYGVSENCVWFTDARYLWPNISPPFRFGMCQHLNGDWQLYRYRYFSDVRVKVD